MLSNLPRRKGDPGSGTQDTAIVLPLPSPETLLSPPPDWDNNDDDDESGNPLPVTGSTLLLGVVKDTKPVIVRRQDGFEKRVFSRCSRCALVVGYEILNAGGEDTDISTGKGENPYTGKIIYILPAGLVSTERMSDATKKKIGGGDVEIREEVAVFE